MKTQSQKLLANKTRAIVLPTSVQQLESKLLSSLSILVLLLVLIISGITGTT